MSDFEFEINNDDGNDDGNDDSDNDNISCDFEYESETETEKTDNEYETDTDTKKLGDKYIIDMDDMDDEPVTKVSTKISTTVSTITKPKLKLKTPTSHSFNSILNMETPEPKVTKDIKTTKKKPIPDTIPETKKESILESKLTKKEKLFEFNPETIDFYTHNLNFKTILIKNSPFTSDIQVICLLLKYKIITDYCCSNKKCKVNTLWLDKPIQLILHRKNNIQTDLTSYNLELICGNCYLSLYGLDIFKKKEKEIIFKCEVCSFPLVQFNNYRKKKGICLACEKRVTKVFTEKMDSDYYTNIQELYHDNPLLSEENKTSNYYKHKNTNAYTNNSTYKPSSI